MKAIMISLAVSAACAGSFAQSQNLIYNNAMTNGLSGEGLKTADRPLWGFYSEVQKGCMVCGFRSANWNGANDRLADDFTVPPCKWELWGATLWMYQTDSVAPSVTGGLFEVRKKTATGAVGGLVATGQFKSCKMTDMFRVFNKQFVDNRWLQQIDVTFDAVLEGGDYYFVWSAKGTWPMSGPWTPYLDNPGFKTTEGANGLQSSNGGSSWYPVQDGLMGQDFPFCFYGQRGLDNRGKGG